MAEIIGVVASVVGLAGAAATVTVRLAECGQTVAHARQELDRLASEVNDLTVVLEFLSITVKQQGNRMTAHAIETVDRLVERCQSALDELTLAVALIKSKSTRISWLFRKSKMLQHKLNLEGFRSNLSLMIQVLLLAKDVEDDSKTPYASVKRETSERTKRNMEILRGAVLTNRSVFRQLKVSIGKTDEKPEPEPSPAPARQGQQSFDTETNNAVFFQDPDYKWDKVLLRSLAELDKNATVSDTLATTIPRSILTAREEKKSAGSKTQAGNVHGSLERELDSEIEVLLNEWTKTSYVDVQSHLERIRQHMRSKMPNVPQWVQDKYEFVGTDPENPEHWKPKSGKAEQDIDATPRTRSAFEPVEAGRIQLFDIFAQEGGAWVWRHDDGFTRDYFVNDKKVMQYFVKPVPLPGQGVATKRPRTVLGRQWIPKHVLQNSEHQFQEYGEGSWAIEGLLTTDAVKELHEASSKRQEHLLQRLGTQNSQPKPAEKESPAQAMFTFDGEEPGDLPFKKGDNLTVLGEIELKNTWWKASLNGRIGQIPSNWVTLL